MSSNMVFCRGCGKEIHETAPTCPHCGAPQANATASNPPAANRPWYDSSFLTVVLLIVFFPLGLLTMWKFKHFHLGVRIAITVLIGLIGLSAIGKKHKGPATLAEAVAESATLPNVDAWTLTNAYEGNEIAGDQQYKGKRLVVSGTVKAIGRGAFNNDYVVLSGSGPIRSVQCFFKDNDEAKKAASLVQGMPIRVSGKVDGLMMNVIVKDCTVLP